MVCLCTIHLDIHQRLEDEGTKLAIAHYGTITNAVAGNPPPADDIIRTAVQIIHKCTFNGAFYVPICRYLIAG